MIRARRLASGPGFWPTVTVAVCLSQLSPAPAIAQSPSAPAPSAPACGTYEYAYPHNTEQLVENHFIVLDCSGDVVRGWYYGTSDEFDRGREGYLPGFFVAEMTDLALSGDSIRFTIQVPKEAYFARPVALRYRDADQVPEDQNERWGIRPESIDPRRYEGTVTNGSIPTDSIVLIVDGESRVFSRVES